MRLKNFVYFLSAVAFIASFQENSFAETRGFKSSVKRVNQSKLELKEHYREGERQAKRLQCLILSYRARPLMVPFELLLKHQMRDEGFKIFKPGDFHMAFRTPVGTVVKFNHQGSKKHWKLSLIHI